MAKKPILDIEINDDAFKNFHTLFKQYTEALGKTPSQWAEMGEAMGASLLAANKAMSDAEKAEKKAREAAGAAAKKEREDAEHIARSWQSAAQHTASLAHNLASATVSLLKWSGISTAIFGLLGTGSLFGLDRLAYSASSARRSSQGLGISVGEQKAFGVQYGRLVGEDKLSQVQEAQYDLSRRGAFAAMGIFNPQDRNSAELTLQLIARAQQLYRPGMSQQELGATGLSQFFSREELNRIKSADLGQLRAGYNRDVRQLGYSDETARGWQDFAVKLRESGETIEKVLIKGLGRLVESGALQKLSDSVIHLVEALAESPKVKEAIDLLANALSNLANWLGGNNKGQAQQVRPSGSSPLMALRDRVFGSNIDAQLSARHNPGNIRIPGTNRFMTYSSDEEGLRAMDRLLLRYEDKHHRDTVSKIMGSYSPPNENDTARIIREVSQRAGFDPKQHLDLHDTDTMAKLIAAITKGENGRSNYTPAQIKLILQNATGGNVVINGNQSAATSQP